MPESRRASIAPWIAAAVAGVVLIALLLAYFLFLRDDKKEVIGQLTSAEKAAVAAAGTEATNLVTYRRDHFDEDY
jgi:succinate dehydrogenase hydrophobic anchor subunit